MSEEVNFEKVMVAFYEMKNEMNRFSSLWTASANGMDHRVATMLVHELRQTKMNAQHFENLVWKWAQQEVEQ
jgi:hypothetical protein